MVSNNTTLAKPGQCKFVNFKWQNGLGPSQKTAGSTRRKTKYGDTTTYKGTLLASLRDDNTFLHVNIIDFYHERVWESGRPLSCHSPIGAHLIYK